MLKNLFDNFDSQNRESLQIGSIVSLGSLKSNQNLANNSKKNLDTKDNNDNYQKNHKSIQHINFNNSKSPISKMKIVDEDEQPYENTDMDAYIQSISNNKLDNNANIKPNLKQSTKYDYNFKDQNIIKQSLNSKSRYDSNDNRNSLNSNQHFIKPESAIMYTHTADNRISKNNSIKNKIQNQDININQNISYITHTSHEEI